MHVYIHIRVYMPPCGAHSCEAYSCILSTVSVTVYCLLSTISGTRKRQHAIQTFLPVSWLTKQYKYKQIQSARWPQNIRTRSPNEHEPIKQHRADIAALPFVYEIATKHRVRAAAPLRHTLTRFNMLQISWILLIHVNWVQNHRNINVCYSPKPWGDGVPFADGISTAIL